MIKTCATSTLSIIVNTAVNRLFNIKFLICSLFAVHFHASGRVDRVETRTISVLIVFIHETHLPE